MTMFFEDTQSGRVPYNELRNISADFFSYEFKGGEGVKHLGRNYHNYEDIYWGETEENPARKKGSSKKNIKGLANSRAQGIDLTCPLPAISPCVITDISGKTYYWKGENGITRKKSDFLNGYTDGAWFDEVDFIETMGRSAAYNREVWLQQENDGLPQESHTKEDLETSCASLIASGDMQKEEAVIRDFVFESAPNMPTQDKNEVVRNVIKGCDVPTKTIAWRDNECKEWLDTKCVDEVNVDYSFPYHYFQDRVYALMKQYHEQKRVLKVVQHFDNKGDNEEYIEAMRETQDHKWEEFRMICKSLSLYMLNNDWQLPFDKDQFYPQIKGENGDDPNRIVGL